MNTKLALHTRTQVLRQGDKDVNFDDSKSGYYYLYNRTISVIKYINDFLEEAVVFYEKFKNLLNWTHPRKTQATLIIMVIFSIIMMYIPLKLLFIGAFMFPFTGIFRPPGGLMWMSEHVISSIPDDITRRKTLENKAPLQLCSLPRATHLPSCLECVRSIFLIIYLHITLTLHEHQRPNTVMYSTP